MAKPATVTQSRYEVIKNKLKQAFQGILCECKTTKSFKDLLLFLLEEDKNNIQTVVAALFAVETIPPNDGSEWPPLMHIYFEVDEEVKSFQTAKVIEMLWVCKDIKLIREVVEKAIFPSSVALEESLAFKISSVEYLCIPAVTGRKILDLYARHKKIVRQPK